MPTCKVHRYHILQAIDMPREQQDEYTSKYLPYDSPLRKDELVEIAMHVWEATGATMPEEGREAFEDHTTVGLRSSIASAIGFDYHEVIDKTEDGTKIVDRDHADAYTKDELRRVREPLHWPERWIDLEYVGAVPANVSKTVNGPARITISAGGVEITEKQVPLGGEVDVAVEFERLGGDDGRV